MQHRARDYFSARTRVEDQANARSGILLIVFSPYNTPYTVQVLVLRTQFGLWNLSNKDSDKVYKGRKKEDRRQSVAYVDPAPFNPLCETNSPIATPMTELRYAPKERPGVQLGYLSSLVNEFHSKGVAIKRFRFPFCNMPQRLRRSTPHTYHVPTLSGYRRHVGVFPVLYAVCSLSRSILTVRGELSEF